MNLSKFVAQDQPLFASLIKDIFPRQTNIPTKTYKSVEDAVKAHIQRVNLINKPQWFLKVIQLYETAQVRHGFMLVGAAGCGKTQIMNTLTESLGNIPGEKKI
jgi:dynein heavy chain